MTCQHNCYAHDTSDGGSISICRTCGAQFDWAGKTLYAGNRSTEVTITRTRYETYSALQDKLTTLLEAAEVCARRWEMASAAWSSPSTKMTSGAFQECADDLSAAVKKAREGL